MAKITYIILFFCVSFSAKSQNYYFPPIVGTTWDTITPQSLGWCVNKVDTLYKFLETTNTKAFIVLKDGKIVMEKYFGAFVRDSNWYWASAGKTLTSLMVGIAQQEGFLNINDLTSKYLGKGWTSELVTKEDKITIRNQLTMTTGLRDGAPDNDCTLPSCLVYTADAGTRWAYHNAPYTLLDTLLEVATKQSFNAYVNTKLRTKIGMNGTITKSGYNSLNISTARSMARYGLLLLNKGKWGTTTILSDTTYFRQMTTSSQNINPSYGYLTWLNGKSTLMVPGTQTVYSTSVSPDAPADMYAALGKNGQLINIVPSKGLVFIRMGNNPDNSFVPFTYNNDIWKRLNNVICDKVSAIENAQNTEGGKAFPNPFTSNLYITFEKDLPNGELNIVNQLGQILKTQKCNDSNIEINTTDLPKGLYWLHLKSNNFQWMKKIVKSE